MASCSLQVESIFLHPGQSSPQTITRHARFHRQMRDSAACACSYGRALLCSRALARACVCVYTHTLMYTAYSDERHCSLVRELRISCRLLPAHTWSKFLYLQEVVCGWVSLWHDLMHTASTVPDCDLPSTHTDVQGSQGECV